MSIAEPSVAPSVRSGGYGELAGEIRRLGLLTPRPWFYARYFAMAFGALVAIIVAMFEWRDSWLLLLLAPVLAVVSTQLAFFGHDVGHRQVTRNMKVSKVIGTLDGNLLGGMSYSWWVAKHNAHHAHPNDLESDPDVGAGAFVFDAGQAGVRRGFAAWWTAHQAVLFFPVLLLEALNLHVSGVREVLKPDRRTEGLLLLLHFVGYVALIGTTMTWVQGLAFVAIHKGLQGFYLGCSFAPSHKGMPELDEEQSQDPLLRQVLTSRNISGGRVAEWIYGGLNYQIEHHLFPSMPRANLHKAQPVVRRFCADNGVSYSELSAFGCYAEAMRHLHEVGAGLRRAA